MTQPVETNKPETQQKLGQSELMRLLGDNADFVASKVLHHIDTMYPNMWKGVAKTARASLRNIIKVEVAVACKSTCSLVAAESYQVIGSLSVDDFEEPGVQKALDYFSDISNGEPCKRHDEILPWDKCEA